MSSSLMICKFCRKEVTVGKLCTLCHHAVCGDHRTSIACRDAPYGKKYYCKPMCGGGQYGIPPPQSGAPITYASASQQAPQAMYGSPIASQPLYGSSLQPQPTRQSSAASPVPVSPYSPGQQQQTSAAPVAAQPLSGTLSTGMPVQRPASASAAAGQAGASAATFGPCAGEPLPLLPPPSDGNVTVRFATGAPCVVPESSMNIVVEMTRAIVGRELRRGDCVEYRIDATAGDSGKRRGVVVGSLNNTVIVVERRSVGGGGGGFGSAACCVPQQSFSSLLYLSLGRCRHCGCLIPYDESRLHVEKVHTSDRGTGTVVDDTLGLIVGNVQLLLGLRPIKQLGEGAQGRVSQCERPSGVEVDRDVASAKYFVLKEINCATPAESSARYQQAVRLMALRHPHIVRYLAVQRTGDQRRVNLVMPYLQEKDLMHTIRNTRESFTEHWICSVVLQLAGALKYLHGHTPPILHGDIKPENVMLYNGLEQVLLMDFDTSVELGRSADGGVASTRSAVGTAEWMAPEMANSGRCSVKSDVWSLGLVAYVLAVLPDFPMLPDGKGELLLLNSAQWTASSLRPMIVSAVRERRYSAGLAELITNMMSVDEATRPSAVSVEQRICEIMEAALLGG